MSTLNSAMSLLGLSTPFLYALATYGLFRFLDRKASGAAKSAINDWCDAKGRKNVDLGSSILELFDRIYERPLWSIRSFGRSALASTVLMLIATIDAVMGPKRDQLLFYPQFFMIFVGGAFVTTVLSDYASLFVVRRFLAIRGKNVAVTVIGGALTGMTIVVIFYIFRVLLVGQLLLIGSAENPGASPEEADEAVYGYYVDMMVAIWEAPRTALLLPALGVHLWLPLFGIGIVFTRVLNSFAWSVSKMQWFLKRGRFHPLEAIGYVTGVFVFVAASTALILAANWP